MTWNAGCYDCGDDANFLERGAAADWATFHTEETHHADTFVVTL